MSLFKEKATQAEGLFLSLPPKVVKVERVWTIEHCLTKARRGPQLSATGHTAARSSQSEASARQGQA